MLNRSKKIKLSIIISLAVLAVLFCACAIYVSDYYRADTVAISAFAEEYTVTGKELRDGVIAYEPENATVGFIFYPGGKVEYNAYEPLMMACAENGVLCVLVEMPFNLAVLDINAADGITELFPDIESWYIGGHSLGGSMASSYAANNGGIFEGVILLGSYSTADLTQARVLSLYGSEDGVMNREKYAKYRPNLPNDAVERIVDGGCHAGFGMYGTQEGDGTPTITSAEQVKIAAKLIKEFVQE